jgi:hypothetical protein
MSGPDPIASPTLARLYLAQGHEVKARAMVKGLLELSPHDGDALALAMRLGDAPGHMSARVEGDDLVVAWQGVPCDGATHVIAVTTRPSRSGVRTGVTSVRCTEPFGRVHFARPPGRGALAVCVGRLTPGIGLQVLAVATPIHWP